MEIEIGDTNHSYTWHPTGYFSAESYVFQAGSITSYNGVALDNELAFYGFFDTAISNFGTGGCVSAQDLTYSTTVGTLEGTSSTIMTQTTPSLANLSYTTGTLLTSLSLSNDGLFTDPDSAALSACVSEEVVFTAFPTNVDYSVSSASY